MRVWGNRGRRILTGAVVGLGLLLPGSSVLATPVTFNFETSAATGHLVGGLTSLTLTQGFLTVTISRTSGAAFDIVSNTSPGQTGKPPSWGNRSLDPFVSLPAGDAWLINFSHGVTSLALQFGDYGFDNDSPVNLDVYSGLGGTGSLLDFDTSSWGAGANFGNVGFGTLFVVPPGGFIRSALFTSDGTFTNSLFWDNITASPVPEPGTLLLLGPALLAAGAWRRRKAQ